tara:strand:+ start:503 stop:1300 length:798 start_codon:yes stop_codon:yes gene_type:complete
MLGKDHINISIAFVLTFLIPLFFIGNIDTTYIAILMISVLIGSLLPDTDCGGKATIYYRFSMIDGFMKSVGKFIVFIFKHLISKKKITAEYDVRDEHRGIMHSPVGVLFGSLILMIPIIIFAVVFDFFNLKIILIIFIGIVIGQFLHLFEDSCTRSGINWGFPFSTINWKGDLITFNKQDKRPKYFAGMFYFLILLIVLGYSFEILREINVILVYLMILIYNVIALFLMRVFSKGTRTKKVREIKEVKKKRRERRKEKSNRNGFF